MEKLPLSRSSKIPWLDVIYGFKAEVHRNEPEVMFHEKLKRMTLKMHNANRHVRDVFKIVAKAGLLL